MESQEIEHFVHAPGGKPQVAFAAPEDTLREVLIRLEVIRDAAGRPSYLRRRVCRGA